MDETGPDRYAVRSPKSKRRYSVTLSNKGWACTCPRFEASKSHCKHIKAVENVCLLPEPDAADTVAVDPVPAGQCPHCLTAGAAKAGVRKNKNYRNQLYKCRSCKRRFFGNFGFEKLKAPPEVVAKALDDFYSGKSTGAIARSLADEMEDPPSQQTVNNWVRSGSRLAALFTNSLDPCLGYKWRVDGMMVSVAGQTMYLHMAIDDATRYLLSHALTPNKATDDVSVLLLDAE